MNTAARLAPILAAALLVPELARAGDGGAGPDATAARPAAVDKNAARAIAELWNRQRAPAPGPPRAIGAYAAGCLQGAVPLTPHGPGYELTHPERRRAFAHPAMVAFIQRLAAAASRQHLGPLMVGDLSQARGGPTPSGHRSHQSGLDADLGYGPPAGLRRARLNVTSGPSNDLPTVVDLRTHKLTAAWTPRARALVELAARDAAVERLFVNPAIKRQLCAELPRDTSWLGRVRPWWGHHDHFHVRLACPTDSPDCQPQDPLPPGDGCAAVEWWFSADAQTAHTKKQEEAPVALPAACAEVLGR